MSRSLPAAKRFVSALAANRRGFASVSTAVARAEEKAASAGKRSVDDLADSPSSSWVPDPVTGYYRPANRAGEVDPAELREMLLRNRTRG